MVLPLPTTTQTDPRESGDVRCLQEGGRAAILQLSNALRCRCMVDENAAACLGRRGLRHVPVQNKTQAKTTMEGVKSVS
eukprot:5047932-Amphidinium_carterae.1